MTQNTRTKLERRMRRKVRVRTLISGTAARPRLNVFRSLRGMYAQLIDDASGKTLVGVTTKGMPKGDAGDRKGKTAEAYLLGKLLADKAKTANITSAVFDRAGYRYHGRVQAVADGARDGGLKV
ncbi:MAG TPA: 50S ribosomal protein L18 [Candidatus Kapabacteria bacterium]|nr:50S ribosomal protein L18 [Candidatus Kapabacteria bacterium]